MNPGQTEIVRVMGQTHGHDISLHDEAFLAKSIQSRLAATGIETASAYCEYLLGNSMEAETLFHALNITFSEFWRTPLTFDFLEQQVLPGLIQEKAKAGRAEIRVWSAACAAGQEAYSIAILLSDLVAACGGALSYRIFATDRSSAEIANAQAGVYGYSAVHNLRLKHIRSFFTQEDETYRIVPALRTRIDFSVYDLLDKHTASPPPSIYGDFDLVICCNLLFYYKQDIRRRILKKVWGSLSEGGYLVTGEAEKGIVRSSLGIRAIHPACAIFRKTDRGR